MYVALLISVKKTQQQKDPQVSINIAPSRNMTHDHMTVQADSICEQSIENNESSVHKSDTNDISSIIDENQFAINVIYNPNIENQHLFKPESFILILNSLKLNKEA